MAADLPQRVDSSWVSGANRTTVRSVSPEPSGAVDRTSWSPVVPAPQRPPGPQADRDLLALHALRQRQLRIAFLHGSRRNWRDTHRIWPAVVIAAVLIGLAVAAVSVVAAFRP